MVELSGKIYVVAPGSLVTISPGTPHMWTACPAGIRLPDGEVSQGNFLMVYEYEDETGFFPTLQTEAYRSVDEYVPYTGSLDAIKFPRMTKEDVVRDTLMVWNRDLVQVALA